MAKTGIIKEEFPYVRLSNGTYVHIFNVPWINNIKIMEKENDDDTTQNKEIAETS
jgi:hypothetical protein